MWSECCCWLRGSQNLALSCLYFLFHPTLCPDVYLIPSSIPGFSILTFLWHVAGGTSPVMRALRANTYAVLRVCSETWRRKIVSLLSAAYVTGHTPLPMFLLGPTGASVPSVEPPLIKVDGPWFELQPALRGTLNRGNQTPTKLAFNMGAFGPQL